MNNASETNGHKRGATEAARAATKWHLANDEIRGDRTRVKTYYASSVEEAMSKARAEMGPDAVLVRSGRAPLEMRHLGGYEVVFAPPRDGRQKTDRPETPGATGSDGKLAAELAAMRRQMEEVQRALALRNVPAAPEPVEDLQAALEMRLRQVGLEDEYASAIARAAAQAHPEPPEAPLDGQATDALLRLELARHLRFAVPAAARKSAAAVVAVAGPAGAGKTTALVKLALARRRTSIRPVHFLSTDWQRVGGAEQLRTYASILGAGMDLVDSPRALAQAIEVNSENGAVLIDTPGAGGGDLEMLGVVANCLAGRTDAEKHLVLPATMRFRDLRRCARRYAAFQPDRLLFTHLDETDCFGPVCSAALWCGLALAFYSGGQQIPEDLDEATEESTMNLLFRTEGGETEANESA